MTAGMAVLVTGALPGPQVIDDAALLAMQFGIDALFAVTGLFAGLPASPWRVTPPPPVLLLLIYGGMAMALCLDMSATARKPTLSAIAVAALAATPLSPAPTAYITRAGQAGICCWPVQWDRPTPSWPGDRAWRCPCHPILPTMPRACLRSLSTQMAAPPMAGLPECYFMAARPAEHALSSRYGDG